MANRYRTTTKIIHKCIIFFHLDEWIARWAVDYPFIRKFVPSPHLYSGTLKKIKRNKAWFVIDPSDYMQWHIFAGIKEIAWQKAVEVAESVDNESIILDIGSNVGAFALKVACNMPANSKTHIFAFDPNPLIKKMFLTNLSINKGAKPNITFVLSAAGNANKEVEFSFDPSNSGAGKIDGKQAMSFNSSVITLDSFAEMNKLNNICFIKIDVEGFEPFVFEGAKKIITKYRPHIYFEITEQWHRKYGRSSREIFEFLISLDYDIYTDEKGTFKKTFCYFQQAESNFQNNFLASPKA
jgi:FkbM family methyltransferase